MPETMEEKLKSLEALKARVKEGNQKLNDAWQRLVKMDHSSQRWEEEAERWSRANEKLSSLCTELKYAGFNDCLYLEDGKKTRGCLTQPGLGCRVCPSQISYWEKELMELPSASKEGKCQ